MDDQDRLSKSVSLVASRVGNVATEVKRALSTAVEVSGLAQSDARWISTGSGASEGPARLLATRLRAEGMAADFVPVSSFVAGVPRADVCVVISQRLSPNARVPLSRADAYRHVLLVTTRPFSGPSHVRVLLHGPHEEDGLLLRVMGPAAANATVLRLASALGGSLPPPIDAVERALRTAGERAAEAMAGIDPIRLLDVAGLVAVGEDVSLCEGLRHKLLEALGRSHPLWDLCGLVHGPLQSFYERDATLVLFEREPSDSEDLTRRLTRVLHPERHRLIRLRSALPGPYALVDFDLQLDHLALGALRAQPRDLVEWPGKGRDAPLYDLGKDLGP